MPKIAEDKETEFKTRIRSILVRQPDITIRQIKAVLEEHPTSPISLDKDYINKLVRKIRRNRAQRLNHYTVNVVLGRFELEAEELKKQLSQMPESDPISLLIEIENATSALKKSIREKGK